MQSLGILGRDVGALLKTRKETLAVAESSAGGVIVYTYAGREALLGITNDEMKGMRSATEAYARLVARRLREKLGATWGLAETGASGPSGNRYGDAPGHACIAVSGPREAAATLETGRADREANMWAFAEHALALLEDCLRRT